MATRPRFIVYLIGSHRMVQRIEVALRPVKWVSELIAIADDVMQYQGDRTALSKEADTNGTSSEGALALLMTDTPLSKDELVAICTSRTAHCHDPRLTAVLRVGTSEGQGTHISAGCRTADLRAIVSLVRQNLELRQCLLEKRSLVKALHSMALRDPLTGLINRRGWKIGIKNLWQEALEKNAFLAVALFDLDGFKKINDQFGHAFGDHVLKTVAAQARKACRKGDLLARWGGDEIALAVVLPDKDVAPVLVERVKSSLRSDFPQLRQSISACVGYVVVRTVVPWRAHFGKQLLEAADVALTQAKASGTACVCEGSVTLPDEQKSIADESRSGVRDRNMDGHAESQP